MQYLTYLVMKLMLKSGTEKGITRNSKADKKNNFNINNVDKRELNNDNRLNDDDEIRKTEVNKYDIPVIEIKNNDKVFLHSQKSVRNAYDDPEDSNNREKASDSRARIVSNEMGNGKGIHDEKKFKYCHEYKFHDKKSCCDEYLACDYRLVKKIEGNKKGGNDIRNSVDKLEYNRMKGKEITVKNNADKGVTKRAEDNYANSKRKISVSKACKYRVMQTKARKRKEHRKVEPNPGHSNLYKNVT
ncbi:16141_t:CDS:2 [Gigaspora rosea]|nr:16141_t:CDS:2 [Gigaspora rosea]